MKRLLVAFLVLGFASAVCLAAESAKAPAPAYKTLTGKVDSVTLADKAKGTKSEIVVVTGEKETAKKTTFLVKDTTTIYDAAGKAITLDKIVKGDTVKVKYSTTKEGVNEALSIKVVKV